MLDKAQASGIGRGRAHGERDAEAETKPVYGVGENPRANIRNCEDDHKAKEEEPFESFKRETKNEVASDEKNGGEKLDGRIHGGNRCTAAAAFPAKQKPRKQRDVVVGFDCRLAVGTTRARGHNGHAIWNPRDADVQKAANDQPEEKEDCSEHTLTVP